jgi:hypothetical protein
VDKAEQSNDNPLILNWPKIRYAYIKRWYNTH